MCIFYFLFFQEKKVNENNKVGTSHSHKCTPFHGDDGTTWRKWLRRPTGMRTPAQEWIPLVGWP